MTKLELIKANKKRYDEELESIKNMSGLQKLVAENLVLAWIKGNNWMGGLSDSKAEKLYEQIESFGYTFEEIDAEWERQIFEVV